MVDLYSLYSWLNSIRTAATNRFFISSSLVKSATAASHNKEKIPENRNSGAKSGNVSVVSYNRKGAYCERQGGNSTREVPTQQEVL